jgi:hypothetical protein
MKISENFEFDDNRGIDCGITIFQSYKYVFISIYKNKFHANTIAKELQDSEIDAYILELKKAKKDINKANKLCKLC